MLKHNKKKNSYIVFEQLLSVMTRLAAQNKHNEAKFVLSVIKEHFKKNCALGKEKILFENILNYSNLKEKDADNILNETLDQAKDINPSELEKEKNRLITDVNNRLSSKLFSIPVKNYKLMASTQILFNETRMKDKIVTPIEQVKIKNQILKNLTKEKDEELIGEVDNLTYKVLLNKFNKKYTDILNEDQRDILSAWSLFVVGQDELKIRMALEEKLDLIKNIIQKNLNKKSDFSDLLKEAHQQILSKKIETIDEDLIYEVLRYFDLTEDLVGDEK